MSAAIRKNDRQIRRAAILLGLLALAFYGGFVALTYFAGAQ
jgi:hypothetical protein